jgi:hypothetical protein
VQLEKRALLEHRAQLVSLVHPGFVETLDRLALRVSKAPKDKLAQLDPSETLAMLVHQARLDLPDRLVPEDSKEVLVHLVRPEQ